MADSDIPQFEPMTPPPPDAPPFAPGTPPTIRPAYQRPTTTTWPMVLGVFCIVFGILGALGGVCGIGGVVMQSWIQSNFMAGMTDEEAQVIMGATERYMPFLLSSHGLNMLLAIGLTVGGIGLTSRRRWSRSVLLHWAWVRMLAVLAAAAVQYAVQRAQFEAMMNDPDIANQGVPVGAIMNAAGAVGVLFTVAWGWALPIFNLVWLNRKVIRNEVETWK